jgi:hypothetical protein
MYQFHQHAKAWQLHLSSYSPGYQSPLSFSTDITTAAIVTNFQQQYVTIIFFNHELEHKHSV